MFREGDPERISGSPFGTLRRLIGDSLFTYVGPKTSHERNIFIREFNSTKSNSEKFDTITKIATAHVNALAGEGSAAEVDNIGHSAENFAVALWGEILYGNPNYHVCGRVLSLSQTIMDLAGDPWSTVWYALQSVLKLVTPGEPTRSEAKLRGRLAKVVENSIAKLEEFERNNPDAPLKTIRNLSVMTGGERTGSLSKFASEFTSLNLFGSFPFIPKRIQSDGPQVDITASGPFLFGYVSFESLFTLRNKILSLETHIKSLYCPNMSNGSKDTLD